MNRSQNQGPTPLEQSTSLETLNSNIFYEVDGSMHCRARNEIFQALKFHVFQLFSYILLYIMYYNFSGSMCRIFIFLKL